MNSNDKTQNVNVEDKQAFGADFDALDNDELAKISGGAIRVERRPGTGGGKKGK